MRIDQKREEELARRKGATRRTLIQLVWLGISFVVAYYAVNWLLAQGYLSIRALYSAGIPATVPVWLVRGAVMALVVLFMQLFLYLGFAFSSPTGRTRSGRPSLKSRRKDPYHDRH